MIREDMETWALFGAVGMALLCALLQIWIAAIAFIIVAIRTHEIRKNLKKQHKRAELMEEEK